MYSKKTSDHVFSREKQVILSCAQNPCDMPFSTGLHNPLNKTANWGWHQCSHGIPKNWRFRSHNLVSTNNPPPPVTTAPLHLLNPPELVALASPATQGILQRHSTTYHNKEICNPSHLLSMSIAIFKCPNILGMLFEAICQGMCKF